MISIFNSEDSLWRILCLRRNVLALLIFFSYLNVYMLRVNLSVGVVGMNANYTRVLENGTKTYVKDVDWNSIERGYALSAYFYGYFLTPLFAGFLSIRFGGVLVFGIGLLFTSLLTLATPFVAVINVYTTIALRILVGFFEGVTFPSIFTVLARWSPPRERTRTCAYAYTACPIGTFMALMLGGILTDKFGWPSIFYFTGTLGTICAVIWLKFAKNQPADDPWISEQERSYIEKSVGVISNRDEVPWKNIFTSGPVFAYSFSIFCESWGYCTLYTQLPTFYNDMFHENVKNSGILSSLSYIAAPVTLLLSGYIANKIIENGSLSITKVRKLWLCIPFLGQALFTLLAPFSSSQTMAMLLFAISNGLGNAAQTTMGTNALDLSPEYAGIASGIAIMMYTLAAFIAPTYAGYITTNKVINEWRTVFFTSCGFYISGSVVYGALGSGEKQTWSTASRQ